MEIKKDSSTYFAAMNTGDGFKSLFSEIFGSLKRLYIIKGAPGTGKSRFMKDVNEEAVLRGFYTEKFLCSSDSSSLDGIIIPSMSLGIIDGTAPHTYEPILSGAKDHIVDLGQFWDTKVLYKDLSEIKDISNRKSRLYSGIYSYLNAIKSYDSIIESIVNETVNFDKMRLVAKKFAGTLGKSGNSQKNIRIRTAISDSGIITLNSYSKNADRRFAVLDTCGVGGYFLSCLLQETMKIGLSATVSYSPLSPTLPDAIFYPESNTSFYIGSESDFEELSINTRRFINDSSLQPYKPKIRAISRLKKEAFNELFIDFRSVKRLHSELEKIYGKAMDFERKEKFSNNFIKSIFD